MLVLEFKLLNYVLKLWNSTSFQLGNTHILVTDWGGGGGGGGKKRGIVGREMLQLQYTNYKQ